MREKVFSKSQLVMFKRALEAKHWMAIGLDSWNEMENQDIPATRVRKMRLVEKKSRANPDEESDASDSASIMSEEEIAPVVPDVSVSSSESEADGAGNFVFCEVCPGRKFLTGKDIESHMKSKHHLKKMAALEKCPVVTPIREEKSIKKSRKEEPKDKIAPSVSNRKARRALVQDTRPQ